jgi:glycosyltransferase involved in cell wall biosynthesis
MANLLLFNLETHADADVLGFTTDWINALARRFDRVFVVTMKAGRIAVLGNVTVMSVGKEKGWSEWRRAREFYRIVAGLLRKERIDACFAHMMPLFTVMAWPLLRSRRIPILLWYAHKSVTPMLRIAERLADGVVTSTPAGFQLPSAKLRVIGQGIDLARFRPPEAGIRGRGRFRLLTLGRVSRIKRVEALFRAAARARTMAPDMDLEIAVAGGTQGSDDAAYREWLADEAVRLDLSGRVEFTGPLAFAETPSEYRRADVFVNTSETQSLDKAILEAMGSGLPVLSSNRGLADVMPPELAGECLVPAGDDESLARALVRVWRMGPDGRALAGSRLRQTVASAHGLDALADKIVAELDRLRGARAPKEAALALR